MRMPDLRIGIFAVTALAITAVVNMRRHPGDRAGMTFDRPRAGSAAGPFHPVDPRQPDCPLIF